MKKSILFLLLSLASNFVSAQRTLSETEKLVSLCRVWGFLKYYHPQVAKGKFDWDEELINHIRLLNGVSDQQQLNNIYAKWIDSLGAVSRCEKCDVVVPDTLKRNLNLGWLDDASVYSALLSGSLHYIQQNRNQGSNHYVQYTPVKNPKFDNEKPYLDLAYPSYEYRLLTLFRYWNIVEYFYPYKYGINGGWDKVLTEMIPKFKYAKDTLAYHLAVLATVCKLGDSHANFRTFVTVKYMGLYYSPVLLKIIDKTAIVTGFADAKLAAMNDMRIGDIILKVNDKSVSDMIDEKLPLISASNPPTRLRNLTYDLLDGASGKVRLTFERDGIVNTKMIHRYSGFAPYDPSKETKRAWTVLDDKIGYVDMGLLQSKDVSKAMSDMEGTKAIIFDIRNYPRGTYAQVADYLNADKKAFAKFTYPDINNPGTFKYLPAVFCGRKNKDHYKGKVVLLADETTQSHAEFTVMALQTAPNVTTIGSQTAGSDGNVSLIPLPGGYGTYITGLGTYYPDGKETQRVGIKVDIEVEPTINSIINKKDIVLQRAIDFIGQGK